MPKTNSKISETSVYPERESKTLELKSRLPARGTEGRDIFCDDEDRNFLLSLLADGIHRNEYKCSTCTLGWKQ